MSSSRGLHELSELSIVDNHSNDTATNATKKSMPKLPVELWEKVISHLELRDVKSLRLASRTWNDIGARFLFQPAFIFRPDRDSYALYDKVSSLPIGTSFKTIRFELGTLPIDYAAHNLGYAYWDRIQTGRREPLLMQGSNGNRAASRILQRRREQLEEEKFAAIAEYAEWNTLWHELSQSYQSLERLEEVFSKAQAVNRIEISYKSCPFKTDIAMDAWMQGSHNNAFFKTNKELATILRALLKAPNMIQHFSHDQLPVSFFLVDIRRVLSVTVPLRQLKTLHLTFDATKFPHTRFWRNLGSFLKTLPELRDLRLDFTPFQTRFANKGTWKDTQYNEDAWYVPLSKMLGTFTWEHLEAIWLGGLMLCETGMVQFFSRHRNTLKTVKLFNIGLLEGSFANVFSCLAGIPLQQFQLWGYFKALHFKDEIWRFSSCAGFYDDSWSKVFRSYVEKRDKEDEVEWQRHSRLYTPHVRAEIEAFVLQDLNDMDSITEWPLTEEDSLRRVDEDEHSEDCAECNFADQEYMDALWAIGLAESLDNFPDSKVQALPGVGEPSIVGFYDRDGRDEFGRDHRGLAPGVLPPPSGQEPIEKTWGSMWKAECHRAMQQGIRSRIPRYAANNAEHVLRVADAVRKSCNGLREVDWND